MLGFGLGAKYRDSTEAEGVIGSDIRCREKSMIILFSPKSYFFALKS